MFTTATMPITVSGQAVHPRSNPPMNGRVSTSGLTPAATGMLAAAIWPSSFTSAGRSKMSSRAPTMATATAPSRIAVVSLLPGNQIQPAISIPARIASPDMRGVATTCWLRGPGSSIAPTRTAKRSAKGTVAQATKAATRKASTASVLSTMPEAFHARAAEGLPVFQPRSDFRPGGEV